MISLASAASLIALGAVAHAEGKNPAEAIGQNLDKNGAFTEIGKPGSGHVSNGNVNFGANGAMAP